RARPAAARDGRRPRSARAAARRRRAASRLPQLRPPAAGDGALRAPRPLGPPRSHPGPARAGGDVAADRRVARRPLSGQVTNPSSPDVRESGVVAGLAASVTALGLLGAGAGFLNG